MVANMISLIGASGNVGRITLALLVQAFGPERIRVAASPLSVGKVLHIEGCNFVLENFNSWEWQPNDIAILNTESDISSHYIPFLLEQNVYVVDSSSHYRLTGNLIVPGVNLNQISSMQGTLFSHANCIVSPIARTLKPLIDKIGIKRVILSTYQSSSGAGKKAQDDLFEATKTFIESGIMIESSVFPQSLVFNIIPQIGDIDKSGCTSEESKIKLELQKLLGDFPISATSVRVPVMVGHCTSLSVQLQEVKNLNDIQALLEIAGLSIADSYVTPLEVVGTDKVSIGRLRQEEDWIHCWVVSDNLRVGAALDSFQIAEFILRQVLKVVN